MGKMCKTFSPMLDPAMVGPLYVNNPNSMVTKIQLIVANGMGMNRHLGEAVAPHFGNISLLRFL